MPQEEQSNEQQKLDLKKLTETLGSIAQGVTALTDRVGTIEQAQSSLSSGIDSLKPKQPDPDQVPSLGELDLEGMSRIDFANAIAGTIVEQIKKEVVAPVSSQVSEVRSSAEERALRDEVTQVQSKNPDFGHYNDVILELSKEKPNHSISDLLVIARDRHPEIGEKYQEEVAANKEDGDKPSQEGGFGGLTPTSGSTVTNEGKLSQDDAANKAWDDTMTGMEQAVGE